MAAIFLYLIFKILKRIEIKIIIIQCTKLSKTKTTFTKQGMVITVGGDLYLRSKDEKYYSVKKEQKPLGISFNRYWR